MHSSMALVAVSALALLPSSSAAWSSSVDALLAKFEPGATDATTFVGLTPLTGYELSYAYTSKHITFAVVADTSGWIGLGIGEAAGMKGADIMMGHFDGSTGKAVVGDYHSTKKASLRVMVAKTGQSTMERRRTGKPYLYSADHFQLGTAMITQFYLK